MALLTDVTPTAKRILVGNGFSALGSGLTMPFLVIYLGDVRGLGIALGGVIVAYIAVVSLFATGPIGALVDRFGPRPVMMISLSITGVGIGCLAFVDSTPKAFAVATIIAIGEAGAWAPQSALYARVTPSEHRQKIFGLQFMMLNLGLGVGGLVAALMVNVDEIATFSNLYLLDSMTFFIYAAILATLRGVGVGPSRDPDEPHLAGETKQGYRLISRDRAMRHLVLASLVLLIFGYGSLEVGLPIYATVIGSLDVSFLGVAFGVNTAVIVIGQLFVIRFLKGRSRSKAAGIVGLFWACAWFIVGISIEFESFIAGGLICLGVAIFAIGETFWSPVVPAIVNDLAPEHLRGRYNAVISLTWGLSGTVGPAFAGIMLGFDLPLLWVGAVVVGCLGSGLFLFRLRRLLTPAQDGMIST
jgi:MFS family permease